MTRGRADLVTPATIPRIDPRAVRVSLAGAEAMGVEPIVVEPPSTGGAPRARLDRLDAVRAVLVRAGQPRTRVLLLPMAPAEDGTGIHRREVVVDGWRFDVATEGASRAALRERARRGHEEAAHSGPTEVHAIIPGVVVSVSVVSGDEVVAGQQLLAVEAMKMQNELRAPRDGVIERVAVGPGTRIEVGDLLLVIA